MSVSVIVLAAGKGTRMNSELPKVLHKVLGKSLLSHALDTLSFSDNKLVVVGHEADLVIDSLPPSIKNILQKDQLGTGHAVSTVINSEVFKECKSEFTLVVPGDVPGIKDGDIELLINEVKTTSAPVGFLTALVEDPFGYGRIVKNNEEIKIVEEKDCSDDERAINEINSGIYCFKTEFLIENIDNLNTQNAQGEFYLTDLIGIANNQKQDIVIVQVDEDSIKGINSMSQLNEVEDIMQKKLIEGFMEQGVYFQDPTSTYIDADVTISSGTKVLANTHLTGSTSIDENCTIGPNAQINDSSIGKNSKVVNSVVDQSTIHENGNIGPFAHIRPGSELGEGVKVGSFAETKKSKIGKGSKVPHLAYVGDAELGENVNFSAGAITVNYDGKEKHKTDIKDGAFIGSDVMLVAPVTIGEESMIGAGSVITKDVPSKALGIERNNQKNVEGYVDRKKKK
ncbi:MAG: bifunctional UDP-N-acetylglucosamine diphosphorylase/glucosamine-1-phosphate N-acetyltransferase GlmU [Candidatus Actinomarina sp.]